MTAPVRVICADALTPEVGRRDLSLHRAMTVAEIVSRCLPGLPVAEHGRVRVVILRGEDAAVIPPDWWSRVTPHPGAVVAIRYVPGLGVAGFLAGFAQGFTASIISGYGITSLAGAQAIFAASYGGAALAIGAVATSLVNALVPTIPTPASRPDPEEIYQLDGWQNQANRGGKIPYPAGTIRMSALYAMIPYNEVIDGDLYLFGLFMWGEGRLRVEDLRVGDTPLESLADDDGDVRVETREGTDTDTPLTLITQQVLQERVSFDLEHSPDGTFDYHNWVTSEGTDQVRLIFFWSGGLIRFTDGKTKSNAVLLAFEISQDGETWQAAQADLEVRAETVTPFFRQVDFTVPSRGQWQVRCYRKDNKGSDEKRTANTTWVFAQSITNRAPIAYPGNLAKSAVAIKSTEAANQTLDALNAVVSRYVDDWDGTAWVPNQITSNPAAIARDVLLAQRANYAPATVAQIASRLIDVDADRTVEAFHAFCAARGLTFNAVLAGGETLGETLSAICAAGRATWEKTGTGWVFITDEARMPVAKITPRNARDIRWSRDLVDTPDAFVVPFRDATNGWTQAERIIPWPGFSGTPQKLERYLLPGKTDPAEVWVEARFAQYRVEHRPDTFTCIQDANIRHTTRGDDVLLVADMLDGAQTAARVINSDTRHVTLDAPVTMLAGKTYGIQWCDFDEADPIGDVVTTSVSTMAGTHRHVLLPRDAPLPPPGREVVFGNASEISVHCRIIRVEPTDDGGARLVLKNEDAQVYDLTAAEVAPAWAPGAGEELATAGTPDAPIIGTIFAEAPEYDYSGSTDLDVVVPVSMPLANSITVARIDVSHRLVGEVTYSVSSIAASTGQVVLTYARDAEIELFATAVSVFGGAGSVSDPTTTETFTVAGVEVTLPTALALGGISATGGLGSVQLTISTQADTAEVQLFRVPAGTALDVDTHQLGDPRSVTPGSTVGLIDGDATRQTLLTAGDMSNAGAWTTSGGVAVTGGQAVHTTGTADTMTQSAAFVAGETYRGSITVSGLTAGTITVRLIGGTPTDLVVVSANGTTLLSGDAGPGNTNIEIAWSSDCDGAVDAVVIFQTSPTSAPQGAFEFFAAPVNADQVATTPTGPLPVTIV